MTKKISVLLGILTGISAFGAEPHPVAPNKMERIATVDERYQSYNVEMAELTGALFWKPYDKMGNLPNSQPSSAGNGQKSDFFARLKETLKPTDLSNPRLRKLAAALGPVYVRASGNVADAIYFHDSDDPAPETPPKGFQTVLTRQRWKGLIDFAKAVDGKIVTSFAISAGTRDANGNWTTNQAKRFLDYTKSVGGEIAAAEFCNEPTIAPQGVGGLPEGYNAKRFARDFAIFLPFARATAPNMLILGPCAIGEGPIRLMQGPLISTADIFTSPPRPQFDVFSYHAYPANSIRCKAPGKLTTTKDAALTEEWLSRTEQTYYFYARLRDQFQPGKPIWITETAESACGGDPWAKTFLDSFRYLDQLGRLARHGVQTVMHNTLDASEYSLIDGKTMEPRPNYWAALLWHRLMGTAVLDSGVSSIEGLHLYAHCLPGQSGGVTLLAINNSENKPQSIDLPMAAERYTLSAQKLDDVQVQLNGQPLKIGANGELPELKAKPIPAGVVEFAPGTITFIAIPKAGNENCR